MNRSAEKIALAQQIRHLNHEAISKLWKAVTPRLDTTKGFEVQDQMRDVVWRIARREISDVEVDLFIDQSSRIGIPPSWFREYFKLAVENIVLKWLIHGLLPVSTLR